MAYDPKHLRRWTFPNDYMGAHWDGYYSTGVGQSRDSSALEESNFYAMLELIGGEQGARDNGPLDENGEEIPLVVVVRESHWAVGWIEWIAVHESAEDALREADKAAERLENYPVLDDDDYSEREWQKCEDIWTDCFNPRERVRYIRNHAYDIPAGSFRALRAGIQRGDWSEASRFLPCPSELAND